MSAFSDALDALARQSALITSLASPFASSDLPTEPIGGLSPSVVQSYRYTHPEGGPFTRAFLLGNDNILETIREAHDHERRLFRFIGEQSLNGAPASSGKSIKGKAGESTSNSQAKSTTTGSSTSTNPSSSSAAANQASSAPGKTIKVVEKRTKGLVTPVKKAGLGGYLAPGVGGVGVGTGGAGTAADEGKRGADGWNDPEVLLKTALTLVNEYRPMPRAKQHILQLLERYSQTQESIQSLQKDIQELSSSAASPSRSAAAAKTKFAPSPSRATQHPSAHDATDPDSWFAAEEEALKELEAQVAAKRKEKRMAFARSARQQQQGGDELKDEDNLLQTSPIRSPVRPLASSGRLALRSSQSASASASSRSPTTPAKPFGTAATPSPTRRTPGATPSRRVVSGGGGSNETLMRTPATINKDTVRSQQALSASQSKPGNGASAVSSSSSSSMRDSAARKPGAGGGLSRTFLGKRLMERTAAAAAAATSAKKDQEARRHAAAEEQEEERSPVRSGGAGDQPQGGAAIESSPSRATRGDDQSGQTDDRSLDQSNAVDEVNDSTTADANAMAEPESNTTEEQDQSTQDADQGAVSAGGQGVTGSPAKTPSAHQRKQVEGIEIRSDVRTATTKIWATLGDVLRSGDSGSAGARDTSSASETIKLIAQLARSDPLPPLSPSSVSTFSTVPGSVNSASNGPKLQPLNQMGIMTCSLLMELLKAPDLAVSMNDLKEVLASQAKAKGWDQGLGTRAIYNGVAKKTIAIDRRAGHGGRVAFAV